MGEWLRALGIASCTKPPVDVVCVCAPVCLPVPDYLRFAGKLSTVCDCVTAGYCLDPHPRGGAVRLRPSCPHWSLSLRRRCCHLYGLPVRSVLLLGQDPAVRVMSTVICEHVFSLWCFSSCGVSLAGWFCVPCLTRGWSSLWDLNDGSTVGRFVDHTKDVLSVAFR